MVNLILCANPINVEHALGEHKKRYPNVPTTVSVCRTETELAAALNLSAQEAGAAGEQRFAIKTQEGVRVVPLSEILYCQCESHRYQAVLAGGEEITSRSFRRSFPQVLAPLLESGAFIQSQASYIVNLRYIKSVGEKQLELHNGVRLPFPLSRQEQARRQLGYSNR